MLVQKDLLQKAGVPQKDIQALEKDLLAYKDAQERPVRQVPNIVCAGIYNAGKSTLLNALCGEDRFPTGDVPTTKTIAQAEFGGAVYIDTPGLNAQEEDDQEAEAAYASADFILFVSSMQNGNISSVEADWLTKLCEQYTADGLRQRLVYVLSNCRQVGEEERDRLRESFRADLEKACGLSPEEIFCVDSLIYLDGKAQNEPLLMEYSGIPNLKTSLTQLIANTEEKLHRAREAELDVLQKTAGAQLSQCKKICESALSKCASQNNAAKVDGLFAEAKKKLDGKLSNSVYISGSLDLSKNEGTTSFEGKFEFSVMQKAKDSVYKFAEKSVRDAKREIGKIFRDVRAKYCNTGMNSRYFRVNEDVNKILEELQLNLVKAGIQVPNVKELKVQPDIDELSGELSNMENGDYSSPSDYIYEGDINIMDFGLGLFDRSYLAFSSSAISSARKEIQEEFDYQKKHAGEWIERFYWGPFVKDLRAEADKQIQSMRQAATAALESTRKSTDQPLCDALDYLCKLEKEIAK